HKQMAQEKELAVEPTFFHEFAPEISRVTVDLKLGSSLNEVTQFRYDVALRRADVLSPQQWLDWKADALTLAPVRALLVGGQPESLGLVGLPNARIELAMKAVDLLSGASIKTVGELRRVIDGNARGGVDPQAVRILGNDLGYGVAVGWLDSGADG